MLQSSWRSSRGEDWRMRALCHHAKIRDVDPYIERKCRERKVRNRFLAVYSCSMASFFVVSLQHTEARSV